MNRLVPLLAAALLLGLLSITGIVASLSNKTLDGLFLLRGPIQPSQDIIIIGVDDDSLAVLGPWPFPRRLHARLLARLHQAGVIGFDFLFSEKSPQDYLFNQAMKTAPPVVLASVRNNDKKILGPAPTLNNCFGSGHIEIILGRDGIVRKARLMQKTDSGLLPAFALVMARAAGQPQQQFPDAPLLINHYGPEHTFLYLSYIDVLQGKIPADFFKNRYVLVGAEAIGIGDTHVTPFTTHFQTPGVEIQATVLNNLVTKTWLRPAPLLSWLAFLATGFLCLFFWPGRTEKFNLLINLILALVIIPTSILFFRKNLFFNPVPALLFLILCYLVHLITERIWTARRIYSEMVSLDNQLAQGLQLIYTNIPTQIFNLEPPPDSGGVRQHLARLQAGVKALSLQHHFIENLLSKKLPPLILWDRKSEKVILANAMFTTFWETFSPRRDDLPQLSDFFHLLKENHDQPQEIPSITDIAPARQPGSSCTLDIRLAAHGRKKFFRVTIHSVIINDIEFDGVLALLTDITEIKELEQLKDEIVSVVSHELKLPLTVILGYAEMLAGNVQGEDRLYVDKISDQARRLNKLIEDFLDVTRLEHGSREIKQLPLDPIVLINEAVELIKQVANQKNITLKQILPTRATPLIGDGSLLLQAITNLLDNAVKFSPEKTEITVKLVEEPENFILCISDQGPGVPTESRDLIFQKFNRGKQEPGREGFGLGLNFVQQVIQRHGGEIWLEPETDCGATFCLILPKKTPSPTTPENDICPQQSVDR